MCKNPWHNPKFLPATTCPLHTFFIQDGEELDNKTLGRVLSFLAEAIYIPLHLGESVNPETAMSQMIVQSRSFDSPEKEALRFILRGYTPPVIRFAFCQKTRTLWKDVTCGEMSNKKPTRSGPLSCDINGNAQAIFFLWTVGFWKSIYFMAWKYTSRADKNNSPLASTRCWKVWVKSVTKKKTTYQKCTRSFCLWTNTWLESRPSTRSLNVRVLSRVQFNGLCSLNSLGQRELSARARSLQALKPRCVVEPLENICVFIKVYSNISVFARYNAVAFPGPVDAPMDMSRKLIPYRAENNSTFLDPSRL